MYAMMQCKTKSENLAHILGYQIWAVTTKQVSLEANGSGASVTIGANLPPK